MPLFRVSEGKLRSLSTIPIKKERDIQRLIEANLWETLEVYFLETEYRTTSGGRMDTLGVDRNGAPTIIEYKKSQNQNVINQGLSYLRWLTTQKLEFFEMLISRKLPENIATEMLVDWKNPRLICIAENFSRFDFDMVAVVPIRIELLTYRFYEDGVFSLEGSQVARRDDPVSATRSAEALGINSRLSNEQIDVLQGRGSEQVQTLFGELRVRVLALGPQVVERQTKAYVAFRTNKNFLEVHIQRTMLKIYLRPIDYDDPKILISKAPETNNWTLDREMRISNAGELEYAMKLIEESYNDVT